MTRQRAKPPSQRQRRVGEEVRHALARIVEQGHFRDPDLQDVKITVTEVRISPDLRHAVCLVLPFGGGDAGRLVAALGRASAYIRSRLAREVELRNVPDLVFEADTRFDRATELDRVLRRPEVARDLAGPAGSALPAEGDEDEGENGEP